MVNKKGYIKTIEAIIAILILLGFFIYMLPREPINTAPVPEDIQLMQSIIMEEISNNPDYRDCLIRNIPDEECNSADLSLKNFLTGTIQPTTIPIYSYSFKACSDTTTCSLPPELSAIKNQQVYVSDSILTDGETYVLVKLFIWRANTL